MMMRRRQFRRGQVLVLFAVMLPILFGFAALAVDAVYAFVAKAAVVTALDAAALAGSRAMGGGNEAAVVNRTFYANLPNDYVIRGRADLSMVGPTREADGTRTIALTASYRSPTFFLNLFGYGGWPLTASAKAGRRDVNIMLVLDRSTSLEGSPWTALKVAATSFVQQFSDGYDKVGLVSFGTNGRVERAPQTTFKAALLGIISNSNFKAAGYTNAPLGVYLAYNELRTLNDMTKENIIVFFTDGLPTALPGQFDVNTNPKNGPWCDISPKEGVFRGEQGRLNQGQITNIFGMYTLQPTAALGTWPITNPLDYVIMSGCSITLSNDRNGYLLLSGVPQGIGMGTGKFRNKWTPPIGPATPISALGYNPNVNLSTITGEHAADYLIEISENMLVNVAGIARRDPLKIRIMTIGLGSVNANILRIVANVPPYVPPYSTSSEPVGLFVYASDQTGLQNAFRQVASAISHLIQ